MATAARAAATAAEPARPWALAPRSRAVVAIAAATFLAHLAVSLWGPYELHRDALLYLAMGDHLRLFRMDAPPFIAIVAETTRALLGDSLAAIRTGPALAHAALILLAGAFARRAGGGAAAQALAAAAVATAPVFLRAGSLFQPVVFDQLWWTLALYALMRIGLAADADAADADAADAVNDGAVGTGAGGAGAGGAGAGGAGVERAALDTDPRRWWLLLGLVLGLGLLTKFTMLVLGAGLLAGVLLSRLRWSLATPWPWLAAALAFLLGSPSFIGQAALGWPFFGQLGDLQSEQLSRVSPLAFALEQVMMVGPVVLVAVAAAVLLVSTRRLRPIRAVGWTAIAAFFLMMAAGGKAYYIAPIWPALVGLGLAEAERWADGLRERSTVAALASWTLLIVVVLGYGAISLPLGLPFLPPAPMARYAAALGVTGAVTTNTGQQLELPQDYADMLGWEELADAVTDVWRALPERDRERGVVLATNYGRAGAIDFYAPPDVPRAVSMVGSYWFWGPGDRPGEVTVIVGAEIETVASYFRSAQVARRVGRPWGVPEERDVPIVVARDPLRPLAEVWPEWAGTN